MRIPPGALWPMAAQACRAITTAPAATPAPSRTANVRGRAMTETPDGRLTPRVSFASGTAALPSGPSWREGGGTVLADGSVAGREPADHCRGRRIDGEQHETDRWCEQRAGLLPADRRGGRAGQELEDVAETDQIADQQALHEQQPGADADHGRHLVANQGADTDADGRPERGSRHAPGDEKRVLPAVQPHVDPPGPKR